MLFALQIELIFILNIKKLILLILKNFFIAMKKTLEISFYDEKVEISQLQIGTQRKLVGRVRSVLFNNSSQSIVVDNIKIMISNTTNSIEYNVDFIDDEKTVFSKYPNLLKSIPLQLDAGQCIEKTLYFDISDVDLKKRTIRISKQVKYIGGELKILPPKTQASNRTINIPPQLALVLGEYRERVDSIWLFPSPVKEEDLPRDPSAVRKAFSKILERAQCKHVPFHALRHTFASNSFHYGMDVKMLANAIGHQSVETTMNVYAHATEEMQRAAARKIDEAIGKALGGDKPRAEPSGESEATDRPNRENTPVAKFEAYKGKKRKPGKGYVKQLSANCWQGRYTPTIDGKRVPMNIYAPTEKECEDKLAELIQEVQAERKAKKQPA